MSGPAGKKSACKYIQGNNTLLNSIFQYLPPVLPGKKQRLYSAPEV